MKEDRFNKTITLKKPMQGRSRFMRRIIEMLLRKCLPVNSKLYKSVLLFGLRFESVKRLKRRNIIRFEFCITEHCNITCKGCSHFSPLSEKYSMPFEVYERDIKRMAELSCGQAE